MKTMVNVQILVSVGEILDKISILSIKSQYIDNKYVLKELQYLIETAKNQSIYDEQYISKLIEVNHKLWTIENNLRICEKNQSFNQEFIELARSVYIINDKRASIKKEINEKYKSEYQEVKHYDF